MKIRISDICPDCCLENVQLGTADAELSARIKAMTMQKLGVGKPEINRKPLRILLLVAAAAAFFATAAFAIAEYTMNVKDVQEQDGVVSGRWLEVGDDGTVLEEQTFYYPDAGMLFTFDGPDYEYNLPEFRTGWLPTEPDFGSPDGEGWSMYLSGQTEGGGIGYIISANSVPTGEDSKYVLNGKTRVVKQENWGGWEVTEIVSDYTECLRRRTYDTANYILMFDPERGYLVIVSGEEDMETLERIAKNLEIRESDEPCRNTYSETVGTLDIGYG